MSSVLVTGPRGTLGSALLPRLLFAGHRVRVLTRRGDGFDARVDVFRGDVRRDEDYLAAGSGVDVVIHAATSPRKNAAVTEIDGARNAVRVAEANSAHLIYPSIVGVDAIGGTYYRAKLQAEELISASRSWTIQRGTQFHPTLDNFVGRVFPSTRHLAFQPLDVGEFADCLLGRLESGDTGRAEDFGGPEVLPLRDMVAIRREVRGPRTMLVPVPSIGPFRALEAGRQLCPKNTQGRRTWRQWLEGTEDGR